MPKRERSTCSDTIMQTTMRASADRHVGAAVVELQVARRMLAHHRQRDLLIAQPLEDVEHGQRIGEHRQREVMAAQPERGQPDEDAGDHADTTPSGMPIHGVMPNFTKAMVMV